MKQALKRSLSILVALALVLSLAVRLSLQHVHAASSFTSVGGWNETLYATISGISDADVKSVTYSGPTSGSLTGEDFEYLVRSTSGGVRLDILGLKAGSYTLTVETTSGTYSQSGIEVPAQDRSGFAHEGNTEGVGAYNDDGTLKDNAVILYVTNTNKNSLTLTAPDGTTVAGIGHILNSAGMDTGNGENASGGLPNNNNGILEKLSAANIPLVVRIVGRVTAPEGVTAEASYDYGGILSDNGSMVRMKGIKNITIEGVGASGTVDGWGFSFIAASGDHAKGYGRNFEVRNLTFENVPEDCVGLEGTAGTSGLDDPIEHCWVHHNTFVGPSLGGGGDKANGDGACDWKRGQYYTNSYNYYNTYRKTNLIGSNDSCLQYYATFHHNYWYDCSQRQPLCRQAEVHLYNNIWYSAGDYCISPRASSYVFVEYSWFDSNSDLVDSSGNIDSLGCEFTNNEQEPTSFNQITDKSQLSSDRLDGTYVESGDYIVQTNIEDMKAVVYSQTGAQRASGDASLDPDAPEAESGSNFIHNFTEHGTTSEFYSISGALSTSKGSTSFAGKSLTQCLVFDSADDYIKFTAPVAGKLTMVFGGSTSDKNNKILVNGTQYTIDSNNQLVTEIEAGDYTITKSDVVHIWYVKYAASEEIPEGEHTHSYTAKVTAPTCTQQGYTTHSCSCGDSYVDTYVDATGHSYSNGLCSVCGAADPNSEHTHSYSETVTAPTCTADGYTTYTCACGDSYTGNTVAATGHTPGAAATCTAAQTCSTCGATLTAALGHDYVDGACSRCGVAAPVAGSYIHNFTTNGFTSDYYTFAGDQLTNGKHGTYTYNFGNGEETLTNALKLDSKGSVTFTAPADGTLTIAAAASSTNRKVGVYDGNGNEVGILAVPNTNTLYVMTVDVSANVTYTVKRSANESGLYYVAFVPNESTGGDVHTHSYTESVTTAATCTVDGVKTFSCSCGDSYTEAIPAAGHTEVTVKGYAATCEADGLTDGVSCSVCQATITAQQTIPALDHDYSSSIKAPTCTADGVRTYTCGNCGDSYTETIAANGHSYSNGSCTVCGAADPNYQAPDENIKNGLARGDDGNYYYYINNEVQWNYTGLIANSAGRWYIASGQAQLSYDGLITFEGTKYLIKAGHVNTAFTGITKQEGVYYYFNAGVNDLEFEGLVYCNGMKAYVQDGEVNFNKTGVVEDEGKLVYVKYGIWRNTFKGLARTDDGKWIYMVNGTFDETYTGVAKLNANWVYVNAGYVDSSYSGTVNVNGVNYTVKYGVVQF